MKKRKININKKAKDWKDRYPMVEVTWVDICSDSSWQSLKHLSETELPICYQALLQRALKLYRVTCVPNDFSKQDPVLTLPDPVPVARWHELRALLLHH
jgi:hypothetical protein